MVKCKMFRAEASRASGVGRILKSILSQTYQSQYIKNIKSSILYKKILFKHK